MESSHRTVPGLAPDTLERLIAEGEEVWREFRELARDRHHLFIPCDHAGAHDALVRLRPRATTFLELGSAAGVVTVMAGLLGYEACGIELESWLVERSVELAERFGARVSFADGSFVPPEYQDEVSLLSAEFLTPAGGAPAYEELGAELADFDLLYAYPWPGDEEWLFELVRRHARPDALLLTYDASEGYRVAPCASAEELAEL